ncbi:MAG TPA: ZIP family metal transporter, partial [Bryobacteraceae bacterium]|nr:ZIP family metal transporter [Bryobacteraceae bacterium]
FGWAASIAWMGAGFALLWAIDRFVYPLCPACSGTHDHDHCESELHGMAMPLLIAAAVHALFDGWGVAAASTASGFGTAFVMGIAIHKLPEGIALGAMTRASLRPRWPAIAWCALAESMTLAGGVLEGMLAGWFNDRGVHALLAVAGGSFLYLGGHALLGSRIRAIAARAARLQRS